MAKEANAMRAEAKRILYENDPEFRKLVDKYDELWRETSGKDINVDKIFNELTKEIEIYEPKTKLPEVGRPAPKVEKPKRAVEAEVKPKVEPKKEIKKLPKSVKEKFNNAIKGIREDIKEDPDGHPAAIIHGRGFTFVDDLEALYDYVVSKGDTGFAKIMEEAGVVKKKPPIPKAKPKEFKVGDVIETSEGLKQTIREIKGNSVYFTDEKGVDYFGFARSTLRTLIKEGAWKKLEVEKPPIPPAKLPDLKKPSEKEVRLMAGLDPGLDKFLAEDAKPIIDKAKEAGRFLYSFTRAIPEIILRALEPAKIVEKRLGHEPYTTVMRAIHRPERKLLEFDEMRLKIFDSNYKEMEKWFNNFSEKELENLMFSRGDPNSGEALMIQDEARKALPTALKEPSIINAIQEIANFNYEYLQTVVGDDITKVEDYFYGLYKNPGMVTKFLDFWRTTERFIKEKKLPTVADAEAFGLKLVDVNPVTNLRKEFRAIARLESLRWMAEELLRIGDSKYIALSTEAPTVSYMAGKMWESVPDPTFKGLVMEPSLANLINKMIATNKITRQPLLNAWRRLNNTLRQIKFLGSAFHLGVEAKQSVADAGYLGFYKPTAIRGITTGFKKDDPIFKTEEYRDYIELGGGHHYSIEAEAQRELIEMFDKISRGNYLGGMIKMGLVPFKVPVGFVEWMFNDYIPKLKYSKYLDFQASQEKKLNRPLTDNEKINIIKEGQNFYGEMNERLFGRSGTVTTALRFVFMAPGFAEGNYRTILKGLFQWGATAKLVKKPTGKFGIKVEKGKNFNANRSRANMFSSLILTAILATVGTLILTRKWPKKPEALEDVRDIFKIDTGVVDDKGRRVLIDLLTYDKDYWNVMFNVLQGRPDKAISESIIRIGGMKATTLGVFSDLTKLMMGEALYDWKGDRVLEITDTFTEQMLKLVIYELNRAQPISLSVYQQSRRREAGVIISILQMVVGVRPTKTEADKEKQKVMSRIYSLKGQQEELYQYLGTIRNPRAAIDEYNTLVMRILNSEMVEKEIKEEWEPKLIVDVERLLSNKVYSLADPKVSQEEIDKKVKWLKNFDIDLDEALKLLQIYWERHPVKNRLSSTHLKNVRARDQRLRERFE